MFQADFHKEAVNFMEAGIDAELNRQEDFTGGSEPSPSVPSQSAASSPIAPSPSSTPYV